MKLFARLGIVAAILLPLVTFNFGGGRESTPSPIGPFGVKKVFAEGTITWPDTDGDGCSDMEEAGPFVWAGGQRDPENPSDFYDVRPRDGEVDTLDVNMVAFWVAVWSQSGGVFYDPEFDRAEVGDDPKDFANLGPPDGQLTIDDYNAVVAQFGSRCLGPITYDLANLEADCDGNIREITDVRDGVFQVPEGKLLRECLLVRDGTGKIVDVILEETVIEKTGEPAGSQPGTWYEESKSVKREQKWPPVRICIFGRCTPQYVTAGLYMACRWKYYYDPGHIYDGVIDPISCRKWHATQFPWSFAESYGIEQRWVVQGFQREAVTDSLFEYDPLGGTVVLQQITFRVGIVYGPWDRSYGWTN